MLEIRPFLLSGCVSCALIMCLKVPTWVHLILKFAIHHLVHNSNAILNSVYEFEINVMLKWTGVVHVEKIILFSSELIFPLRFPLLCPPLRKRWTWTTIMIMSYRPLTWYAKFEANVKTRFPFWRMWSTSTAEKGGSCFSTYHFTIHFIHCTERVHISPFPRRLFLGPQRVNFY